MEVHHHSQSPRKKWKHYLFEFLMLFLAVFCGFLAENQREHLIEHKREKQLIRALIDDLRLDTSWLSFVSSSTRTRMRNLDSAILYMSRNDAPEIPAEVFRYFRSATTQVMFFPNNGTIAQLKNAGGMRLIRNRTVVDSIENYDRMCNRLEIRRDITNEQLQRYTELLGRAMNGKDLLGAYYDSVFYRKPITRRTVALNQPYVNELMNMSIWMRSRAASDTVANTQSRISALNLMRLLEDAYDLK